MDSSSGAIKKNIDCIGIKEVANKTKLSTSLIYKWMEGGESSSSPNPLDRIVSLTEATNDTSLIDWLCQKFGGTFVVNKMGDEVFDMEKFNVHYLEISKIQSELNTAILSAKIADPELDQSGIDEIKEQWYLAKKHIESFVNACEKWVSKKNK